VRVSGRVYQHAEQLKRVAALHRTPPCASTYTYKTKSLSHTLSLQNQLTGCIPAGGHSFTAALRKSSLNTQERDVERKLGVLSLFSLLLCFFLPFPFSLICVLRAILDWGDRASIIYFCKLIPCIAVTKGELYIQSALG
jgi:hypothetical protein